MGIDTRIYCKTRDGEAPALNDVLPGVEAVDPRFYYPEGATHEVDNPWRYYDEYNPRGPWPKISATLAVLLAAPNVETVWYIPDVGADQGRRERPITAERVRELDKHYAAPVRP